MERNIKLKLSPERWQNLENVSGRFDIVFCFEQRILDLLLEDIQSREPIDLLPIHIINLDVPDTTEEASKAAVVALELCKLCDEADDLEVALPNIVDQVQEKYNRSIQHFIEYV